MPKSWYDEFTVKTGLEDVLRFYEARFKSVNREYAETPKESIKPGYASPVFLRCEPYSQALLKDKKENTWDGGTMSFPGKQFNAALERTRKPYKPGVWVTEAQFDWEIGEVNGDASYYSIEINDEVDTSMRAEPADFSSYKPITRLSMSGRTERNAPEVDRLNEKARKGQEQTFSDINRQVESAKTEFSMAPTDQQLGIAIYPGSVYDSAMTILMNTFLGDTMRVYVFDLKGEIPKAVSFYEIKTGMKAKKVADPETGQEGFLFTLKGNEQNPEIQLAIGKIQNAGHPDKNAIVFTKTIH
jgi:hypothetical protein